MIDDETVHPGKNASRIASLMGTWTTYADLKASFGNYHVKTYFVAHFMPDPMSQYACEITNEEAEEGNDQPQEASSSCREWDNRICQKSAPSKINGKWTEVKTCHDIPQVVSEWSDVAVFYNIGIEIVAGYPFRVNKFMDTGGWIGPFNLVLAQDTTTTTTSQNATTVHDSTTTTPPQLLDRYRVRYVATASTPNLSRRPINDTLFSGGVKYDAIMGATAVNTTRNMQANFTQTRSDPYAPYHKTCRHGDLQPILPLYGFDFVRAAASPKDNNNNNTDQQEEDLQVHVDYQLVLAPQIHNTAYKYMPWMQREINRQQMGFTLEGPYCYEQDPKRAWSIAVHMNASFASDSDVASSSSSPAVHLQRGCVQGLPCLPPAAGGGPHDPSSSPVHPSDTTNLLDVNKLLWQMGFWCMVIIWLVTLWIGHRRQRRDADSRTGTASETPPPRDSSTTLTTPLLDHPVERADDPGSQHGNDHENHAVSTNQTCCSQEAATENDVNEEEDPIATPTDGGAEHGNNDATALSNDTMV